MSQPSIDGDAARTHVGVGTGVGVAGGGVGVGATVAGGGAAVAVRATVGDGRAATGDGAAGAGELGDGDAVGAIVTGTVGVGEGGAETVTSATELVGVAEGLDVAALSACGAAPPQEIAAPTEMRSAILPTTATGCAERSSERPRR